MYDTVLVPTDGSSKVGRAVEQAIDLAVTYGATLHALYVVDVGSISGEAELGTVVQSLEKTGEEATGAVADRAREAGVADVRTAVRTGSAHETILEYADDNDADLIVMGTHGRRGLQRFLLGSVTERVVRTSEVPVLTVRMTDDPADTE